MISPKPLQFIKKILRNFYIVEFRYWWLYDTVYKQSQCKHCQNNLSDYTETAPNCDFYLSGAIYVDGLYQLTYIHQLALKLHNMHVAITCFLCTNQTEIEPVCCTLVKGELQSRRTFHNSNIQLITCHCHLLKKIANS